MEIYLWKKLSKVISYMKYWDKWKKLYLEKLFPTSAFGQDHLNN